MATFCVCMGFYAQNAPYRLFVDLGKSKQKDNANGGTCWSVIPIRGSSLFDMP